MTDIVGRGERIKELRFFVHIKINELHIVYAKCRTVERSSPRYLTLPLLFPFFRYQLRTPESPDIDCRLVGSVGRHPRAGPGNPPPSPCHGPELPDLASPWKQKPVQDKITCHSVASVALLASRFNLSSAMTNGEICEGAPLQYLVDIWA